MGQEEPAGGVWTLSVVTDSSWGRPLRAPCPRGVGPGLVCRQLANGDSGGICLPARRAGGVPWVDAACCVWGTVDEPSLGVWSR